MKYQGEYSIVVIGDNTTIREYVTVNRGTKDKEKTVVGKNCLIMKLGTSYPYGPFEWCNRIGIKNIFRLLKELEKTNSRYKPADLLEQEAIASWHLS